MKKNRKSPTLLQVHSQADGKGTLLGVLSYDVRRQHGAFQWSDEALEQGVEWSPIHLPLNKNLWLAGVKEREIAGLPGLIHDALPDGWGVLLMDRAFGQAGIRRDEISPLMRLAYLADRRWGALRFEPQWGEDLGKRQQATLARLSEEAKAIEEGDTERVSEALLVAGGSPHGARPKILVAINSGGDHALVGHETLPDGYRHVLVKFAARDEHPSAPLLEYCYVEAARRAGIETALTQLRDIRGNPAICFDRFDRVDGQKRHVHSLAGMMHVTHRVANTDWEHVAGILKRLPGGEAGLHEAFRRAVFNAVFCVRDDHAKNHAFLRHPDNQWAMTPAYDIAYSDGPGGYHTMMYAGHTGKNVTAQDLVRLGEHFGVDVAAVAAERERALEARTHMMSEAKGLGVPKTILANIVRRFKEIDKDMKPKTPRKKPAAGT